MYSRPGGDVGKVTKYGRVIGYEVVGPRGRWTEWKLWDREVRFLRLLEYAGRGSSRGWVSAWWLNRYYGFKYSSGLGGLARVLVCSGCVRRRKIGGRTYYGISGYGREVLAGLPEEAWGGVSVEAEFADRGCDWDLGL